MARAGRRGSGSRQEELKLHFALILHGKDEGSSGTVDVVVGEQNVDAADYDDAISQQLPLDGNRDRAGDSVNSQVPGGLDRKWGAGFRHGAEVDGTLAAMELMGAERVARFEPYTSEALSGYAGGSDQLAYEAVRYAWRATHLGPAIEIYDLPRERKRDAGDGADR